MFERADNNAVNIIGVSKHICGMASDLSIETLLNNNNNL
jgi:hypothetical protein